MKLISSLLIASSTILGASASLATNWANPMKPRSFIEYDVGSDEGDTLNIEVATAFFKACSAPFDLQIGQLDEHTYVVTFLPQMQTLGGCSTEQARTMQVSRTFSIDLPGPASRDTKSARVLVEQRDGLEAHRLVLTVEE